MISYNFKLRRFQNASGRIISNASGLLSSNARKHLLPYRIKNEPYKFTLARLQEFGHLLSGKKAKKSIAKKVVEAPKRKISKKFYELDDTLTPLSDLDFLDNLEDDISIDPRFRS